jgi:hypothetical protein
MPLKDAINYLMDLFASLQQNNKKYLAFKDDKKYLKSLIESLHSKINMYFA